LSQPGGPLVARIAAEFGPEFVREDGSLARRELARCVFRETAAAARLNAATHAVIIAEVEQRIERIRARAETSVICLVAPLLLEAGYGRGKGVDRVLVMTAAEDERVRRVMERDGLTAEEVEERIAAQMPVREQRRYADWVVDTTAGKQEALTQLERVWAELTGE
jgi:dephospho-CoA kinase